jgi:hypothetical protein
MDVSKITRFVERPETDLAARKGVVGYGKTRLWFIVNEDFDGARTDLALDADLVPVLVRQHGRRFGARDAAAGSAVHEENPVVNRLFGAGVNG